MKSNEYPGKFIVFEGLDGSGQSTQVKLLTDYLTKQGKSVLSTKEPTQTTDPGKEIIEILSHRKTVTPEALQELFVADRRIHIDEVIIPALMKGDIVISDRYMLSSMAFGSIDCDLEWLKKLHEDFLWPDTTFILRVRAETSIGRISNRGKSPEFFEKKEKLEKVAVNYDNLSHTFSDCIVLDGEQTPEAVHEQVIQNIKKLL